MRGVATGDMGVAKDGIAQGRVPARHGAPREVHAVRRRLPRLAVAGAHAALQPARRRRSAEVRHRLQGAVAARAGQAPEGARAAQPGLAARPDDRRRLVRLPLRRRPGVRRIRRPPQLREPAPVAVRRIPALQDASRDPRHVRRRQAARVRRARDQRGRPAIGAEARVSRRRADRLRRGLREPAADQGLAQRDEDRDAGRRSRVRRGRGRTRARRARDLRRRVPQVVGVRGPVQGAQREAGPQVGHVGRDDPRRHPHVAERPRPRRARAVDAAPRQAGSRVAQVRRPRCRRSTIRSTTAC